MCGTEVRPGPKLPEADRFVMPGGRPYPVPCNSRLPLVIYAPAGVEVRYRLWRAEPKAAVADKGSWRTSGRPAAFPRFAATVYSAGR